MGIQFDGNASVSRAQNAATLRRHFDALEAFLVVGKKVCCGYRLLPDNKAASICI